MPNHAEMIKTWKGNRKECRTSNAYQELAKNKKYYIKMAGKIKSDTFHEENSV